MRQLEIHIESYPEGQVVRLRGSAGMEDAVELRDILRKLAEPSEGRLVLDLQGLLFAGSMGLSALIEANSECQKNNRELILAHLQPAIMKVMKTTQLDHLFTMTATVEDALKKPTA